MGKLTAAQMAAHLGEGCTAHSIRNYLVKERKKHPATGYLTIRGENHCNARHPDYMVAWCKQARAEGHLLQHIANLTGTSASMVQYWCSPKSRGMR